ncbi:DUF4129 domain-containing protein [Arthrobacter sp. MDB2-24]
MTTGTLPFLVPDSDEARRLLEEELAKAAYVEAQPNLVERMLGDILRSIVRLLDGLGGLGAGPGTLVVAIGAALLILLAVVLIKPRLNARGRTSEAGVFDDTGKRSGAHHRNRAAGLARNGDWNAAVAELLRAIIRSAEERLVIEEQPGRTATEAGLHLGGVFPSLSSDVAWLADLFNETRYGSGTATDEDYRRAAGLDTRLSSERPLRAGGTTPLVAPQ